MSAGADAIAPAQLSSLQQRYPRAFSRTPLQRMVMAALIFA